MLNIFCLLNYHRLIKLFIFIRIKRRSLPREFYHSKSVLSISIYNNLLKYVCYAIYYIDFIFYFYINDYLLK